ncbi:MAG: 50S ribosomal protein L29 [Nanoarchaeota archaeon]|nr:50S ribosomal protein L29 [Nanoarchaeota archaeon]
MKFKEIQKMSDAERAKRLKELKLELIKSQTGASKQRSSKAKEIRKIIARIHTLNNLNKLGVENNK